MNEEKTYTVKGDLIIEGTINGDLTIYIEHYNNVLVKANVSGNTNLNVNGMDDDAKVEQKILHS